jgi:hypothetical protein
MHACRILSLAAARMAATVFRATIILAVRLLCFAVLRRSLHNRREESLSASP